MEASRHITAPLTLADIQLTYWLLWVGSFALCVTLVVLLYTRWGQSRPLHKCAALSLIVHLMLAFLTMTVRIVNGDGGGGGGAPIHVRIDVENSRHQAYPMLAAVELNASLDQRPELAPPELLEPPPEKEEPQSATRSESPPPKADDTPVVVDVSKKSPTPAQDVIESASKNAQTLALGEATKQSAAAGEEIQKPSQSMSEAQTTSSTVASTPIAAAPDTITKPPAGDSAATVAAPNDLAAPTVYSLRAAPGRFGLVAGQGGNAETEAAVAAALKWLAENQSRDGRWDADEFGAGREEMTLGQNRNGAGRGADTGVTALALLAFLGGGHSHVQGPYQDNVRRGLDFLLRSQATDGSLFGDATLYAQMYCHSMATFALAEAEAVTGDRRLEAAVTKAANYCLTAQNPSTGGWRYRPGDTGDTSQLGWQIMALASVKRAGIKVPDQTWFRIERFLRSVERGSSGGLASYRPDSPMSTSMTAEALYCRLVLEEMSGVAMNEAAAAEATSQLLASPPSADRINLYYWYYATLALHHRQNATIAATAAWRTWNDEMTAALTVSQESDGSNAGSWSTNSIWGGYGGRIYTTAMAAMCLEVYYRYAPAPPRGTTWSASRSDPSLPVR